MKRCNRWPLLGLLVAVCLIAACTGGDAGLPPDERPIAVQQLPSEREQYRKLPFAGAHNFRDLGGYRTADGKTVKWGVLYRSDDLADLTDDDLLFMERLGLAQVVDLRSPFEKAEDPDRLPDSVRYVELPVDVEGTAVKEMFEAIVSGNTGNLDLDNILVDANRAFVTDTLEPFRSYVHSLLDPQNLPSVAHCTGGKDRAGFTAAVTLLALGVPREQIVHDFMLTNTYTEEQIEKYMWMIRFGSLFRTDPEEVRPLLGVEQRYIDAAFDAMEAEYGSLDNFVREGLQLDDGQLAKLRKNLLEG